VVVLQVKGPLDLLEQQVQLAQPDLKAQLVPREQLEQQAQE
jgi:hypothetical protein